MMIHLEWSAKQVSGKAYNMRSLGNLAGMGFWVCIAGGQARFQASLKQKNLGRENGLCNKAVSRATPNIRHNFIFLPPIFLPMILLLLDFFCPHDWLGC